MALDEGGWSTSRPRPIDTRERDRVPIVQEAVWELGPVRTGAENLASNGIGSPVLPSIYRLSYPGPQLVTTSFSKLKNENKVY
jgi:hypothetical protein